MIIIKQYDGININDLTVLGQGTQGTVYKIDNEKCIKIFKKSKSCNDEINSLLLAQGNPFFPILYSYGKNYIVREYIDGLQLDNYLLSNPFTPTLARGVIELYEAMSYIGYTRLDCALFHIFITCTNEIKLIDTSKAMKEKKVYPYLIIKGLDSFGYKNQFLSLVKIIKPNIYNTWIKQKLFD